MKRRQLRKPVAAQIRRSVKIRGEEDYMIREKPEKPWENIAPKPDPDRLLKLDPRNLGSAEKTDSGVEYAFDADREMIDEVASKSNISELTQKLKGKEKKAALALFSTFGTELMKRVAEVGEGHKDRAWEMIEICTKQTGISFPHVLHRTSPRCSAG